MSVKNEPDDHKSTRSRRSKACKHCHALKVRCIPVKEDDPMSPCVRCVNAGRTCEIDHAEQRKRRRRSPTAPSESLVADLHDEISALKDQLEAYRSGHVPPASGSSQVSFTPQSTSDAASPPFMTKTDLIKELGLFGGEIVSLKDLSDQTKASCELRVDLLHKNKVIDVVSCKLITREVAQERLDIYRNVLYRLHPFVEIPESATVDDMIRRSPFLFNCIMCVTFQISKDDNNKLFFELERHALSHVIHEVMICGTKSLELIKSLSLLSIWYNSPEFFRSRRYHILNSVAVTMLHDLGYGSKSSLEVEARAESPDNVNDLEYRHIVLTLYLTTVGFCLILRRSIFVNWTVYVEECCEVLERSGNPSYKTIVSAARLTHELERIHHLIHIQEQEKSRASISSFSIQDLMTKLLLIKKRCPSDNHLFFSYYYSVEAYLYQPMLDDLKLACNNVTNPQGLNSRTVCTISKCTNACELSMNEFSSLTDLEIATLPLFHLSRIVYTAGILLRLRYFILSLPSNIEKDLVPVSAVMAILNVNKRITTVADLYPNHHLAAKMKLILRIFVETYYSQVSQLLLKDDDGSHRKHFSRMNKNDYKELTRLAKVLIHQQNGDTASNTAGPGLHLDLLSYVATEHRKNSNAGQEDQPSPGAVDPMSQPPPLLHPQAMPRLNASRNNFGVAVPPFAPMPKTPVSLRQTHPVPLKPLESQGLRNDFEGRSPGSDYRRDSLVGVLNPDPQDFPKDYINEFDDEFWANLLSTGEDSYQFAPNVPLENPLFGVFN